MFNMKVSVFYYSIVCFFFFIACSSTSTDSNKESTPTIKQVPMTQNVVSGMGGCQHKQSGLCFERDGWKESDKGCTNTEIERHLPAGCPVEGRVARCEFFNGLGRVWAYSQKNVDVARTVCSQKNGKWKTY